MHKVFQLNMGPGWPCEGGVESRGLTGAFEFVLSVLTHLCLYLPTVSLQSLGAVVT